MDDRLRSFAPAWLAGEARARTLLPDAYARPQERVRAVASAAERGCDRRLVAEIARQHADLPPSETRSRNLEALGRGECALVATGQQVGLFTGPLYTIYKAASAVVTARELARESGRACVPLFWLATEDHDFAEIDHCFVAGNGSAPLRIDLVEHDAMSPPAGAARGGAPLPIDAFERGTAPSPPATRDMGARAERDSRSAAARVSVAERRLGPEIDAALERLRAALAGRPHADEVMALLARAYRPGRTPAGAFRHAMAELFVSEGLLFLDPRTEAVAELARPVFERSLAEAEAFAAVLGDRAAAIEAAGYRVQVPVRAGAPLCFYHPEGASGPRYRLEPVARERWRLSGGSGELTCKDAQGALARDALSFSTSALLRPLLQDMLLPVAATVAGPGEIAYLAELPPLYEALGIAMPVVVPRAAFYVTDAGTRRRLEALGLAYDDLLQATDEDLLARITAARDAGDTTTAPPSPDELEHELAADFFARLERVATHALALDPGLARPIAKTRESVRFSVGRLVESYRGAWLRRDRTTTERLARLRAVLAPREIAQERVFTLASFAAEHGAESFVRTVLGAVRPFDGTMREIAL